MPRLYRSREGEATAVDTKTQLTTLGSETAPGPLIVPAGSTALAGVIISAAADYAATGSASALVRIEGSGLPKGPETISAGALGASLATGVQHGNIAIFIPLNVEVTPGNELLLFGEMDGGDVGQISFVVTVVFEA